MKKSILIIGAGDSQVSIIKTAKAQGLYVLVASPVPDEPGVAYADEYYECDIFDIDSLEAYARAKAVNGVLTDQSDKATPVVAKLAERLGLPGYGYENSLCFTDKAKMREVFKALDLPVAENYTTSNVTEAIVHANSIGFPVVIKPVDSFASRGVHVVLNENELLERYGDSLSTSKKKLVIVERYIEGSQYFSQGYVVNGKLQLFAFSDRYYFDVPDVCLPYTNAFPALIDDELRTRMINDFSKVVSHLNPQFGQVWAEWILDKHSNCLYLIEMAIRGAGAYVTTDVIPNAYGVDTQVFLVNDAVGNHHDWFHGLSLKHNASAFFCFLLPPGKVLRADGLENISSIDGVTSIHLKPIRVGDTIEPYKDKNSRYGPIVVKASTRTEMSNIHKALKDTIHIDIIGVDGVIRHAIWE